MWKLSAVIITRNEARNIRRCLASIASVADEIVVIDSFSEDDTPAIVEGFANTRLIRQAWSGFGPQKALGIREAIYDHILSIDADEALDEELIAAIKAAKQGEPAPLYSFSRLNYYYTKFLRHGAEYPDHKIRIFRKDNAAWSGDLVHETLIVKPGLRAVLLPGHLLHYTYYRIEEHIRKANIYTSLAAQNQFNKGRKTNWGKILFSPVAAFFQAYLIRGGFRDGANGFIAAVFHAYGSYMKYVKLWELHQKPLAG